MFSYLLAHMSSGNLSQRKPNKRLYEAVRLLLNGCQMSLLNSDSYACYWRGQLTAITDGRANRRVSIVYDI